MTEPPKPLSPALVEWLFDVRLADPVDAENLIEALD
jgi:hypothetical protein